MNYLRQSTAASVKFGPFVDDADAKTPETELVIQKADVRVSKNGGNMAAASSDQGASDAGAPHDELGVYDGSLNTTDTNTLGLLRVDILKAGALSWWKEWEVIPAPVYDSLIAGSDKLQVDVQEVGGDAQSLTDLKDFVDSGYDPAVNKIEGVKLADALTGYVAPLDAAGTRAAVGLGSANLDGQLTNIEAETSAAQAVVESPTYGNNALKGLIDTINGLVDELESRLTAVRAAFLDNLNVGGPVASSAEATAIQNNTRVVRVVPDVLERPDSGTVAYRIELLLYDSVGNMETPDTAPSIALVNQSGTDRSSRLDSTTMVLVSAGRYRAIYTADAGDALEQLVWSFSVVEGGNTRIYGNQSVIVDTTAVDFTAADRAKLDAVHGKLPSKSFLAGTANPDGDVQADEMTGSFGGSVASVLALGTQAKLDVNAEADSALADYDAPTKAEFDAAVALLATATDLTAVLTRMGAFSGTGANTLLGILKAIASKSAAIPSDIGGTFNNATDSLEALQESLAAKAEPGDEMAIGMSQLYPIPGAETPGSLGEALQAAATLLGNERVVGLEYTVETPAGDEAAVFDLVLNEAGSPTSRTRQ